MVKNEVGQFCLWTLKLTVSQERTDGTDFLHVDAWSQKLKPDQRFGWEWSKMGKASLVTGLKNEQVE